MKLDVMFRSAEKDERVLIEKTRRLELSLRSISQEGLLPQMMTDNDLTETKEAVKKFRREVCLDGKEEETPSSSKNRNVLQRLLEESELQDFVGGWRL